MIWKILAAALLAASIAGIAAGITIATGTERYPDRELAQTLIHEVLHVIDEKRHVFGATDDEAAHRRLDDTAAALVTVLMENGWLK